MKTTTFLGYAIRTLLAMVATSSVLYGQSSVVFDAGTTIDVGSGADIHADAFTFNGTRSGSGTFTTGSSGVDDGALVRTPKEFALLQNYPNPFNPNTTISFDLPSKSFVSLKVYDALGREVSVLVLNELPAGTYTREWNGASMPSGVYFYRLQAGSFVETKKLVLLK